MGSSSSYRDRDQLRIDGGEVRGRDRQKERQKELQKGEWGIE